MIKLNSLSYLDEYADSFTRVQVYLSVANQINGDVWSYSKFYVYVPVVEYCVAIDLRNAIYRNVNYD